MPVDMGPRTFLEPNLDPGVHFHRVTEMVTVQGVLLGWDAGIPSVAERQEAREEDDIEDPEGMAAAIIQEAGGNFPHSTAGSGDGPGRGGPLHECGHQVGLGGHWPPPGKQHDVCLGDSGLAVGSGGHRSVCGRPQGEVHDGSHRP